MTELRTFTQINDPDYQHVLDHFESLSTTNDFLGEHDIILISSIVMNLRNCFINNDIGIPLNPVLIKTRNKLIEKSRYLSNLQIDINSELNTNLLLEIFSNMPSRDIREIIEVYESDGMEYY